MVQSSNAWYGLVLYGTVWLGPVRLWSGQVLSVTGLVRSCPVCYGLVRSCTLQSGQVLYDMVWSGPVRYGLVRYGQHLYGIVWSGPVQ